MANTLDETKYFKLDQARKLMRFCQNIWKQLNGSILPARDAFLIELGLSTGLRVHEMAALECQDLQVTNGMRSVVVRKGKGKKRRVVRISRTFQRQCTRFLRIKESFGEPTCPDAPVFFSMQRTNGLTTRTLQRTFKRVIQRLSLPTYYSIHALRHTFGTQLCRASGYNLRLVQDQMGHASIKSTEIYLHVEDETVDEAVESHAKLLQGREDNPG